MFSTDNLTRVGIIGYSIPRLHKGDRWYVDFYAFDPVEQKIRRKKYFLNTIKSKKDRAAYAASLIRNLTEQLSRGWRPWQDDPHAGAGYVPLERCFTSYLSKVEKTGRLKTLRSYTSRVNILKEYFSTIPDAPAYPCQLTKGIALGFLDWLIVTREVNPRTRNNYRNWLFSFCDYLKERGHIAENPVEGIDKMREHPKIRKSIDSRTLDRIFDYLKQTDTDFLLAVMMEYYTFIRPQELTNVRLRDISIRNQSVFVPAEVSKNWRDGYVALPEVVLQRMIDNGVFRHSDECYLFSKGFRPGLKKCRADVFNKRWALMRKALELGPEFQFYSLKDTGIRDLANAEGIVTARNQARHSDISTTNKYLSDGSVPEAAKHFRGAFDDA